MSVEHNGSSRVAQRKAVGAGWDWNLTGAESQCCGRKKPIKNLTKILNRLFSKLDKEQYEEGAGSVKITASADEGVVWAMRKDHCSGS